LNLDVRRRALDRAKILGGELDIDSAAVLLESMQFRRARDRDDSRFVRE